MDPLRPLPEVTAVEMIGKIDGLNKQAWEVHITQPKLALELSSEAKILSEEYSYQKGLAYAIRNMGVSHRYLSNLETALSLSFQALDMFVQMGDKSGEAQSNVSIGAIYYYMGDYERSLDLFLKGLRYSEEIGNKEAQAYAYNGAGYTYAIAFGDNKKGFEFLEKALTLSKEIGMSQDLQPRVLDSIAEVYLNDGQLDKAYETSLEVLKISEELSQKVLKNYALFKIGLVFLKQDRMHEAKNYFLQCLNFLREIDDKFGVANTLLHLGKLSLIQANAKQAKEYLLESLKVSEDVKAKAVIYEAHEALAELFEKEKDIQSFIKHYKLFHKYKSEVFRDEQENKQKYLTIQYEIEKLQREAEINRLTNVVMKEKNAELEKKTVSLQHALNELKLTQEQLIQSEKMASLGELTAGIAHEIQNPLNFVNNFSELNKELLAEMNAEIDKGNFEEVKTIAKDVTDNEQKINHHGKRADVIVKGMLQHSRASSGQKEPTEINALADEYLRLAYHGLRAKDKNFAAKFETSFDSSIGKINILQQDMGRVILNLVNNAFYAVTEKKKQHPNGYEPTVTVSTKKLNGKIELRVIDNGNGIPEKVLGKIFQPFFTTKPTGQGTGLGLSLSYDIITKGHGGELKVETKEGEGSEFIIQLPAN